MQKIIKRCKERNENEYKEETEEAKDIKIFLICHNPLRKTEKKLEKKLEKKGEEEEVDKIKEQGRVDINMYKCTRK